MCHYYYCSCWCCCCCCAFAAAAAAVTVVDLPFCALLFHPNVFHRLLLSFMPLSSSSSFYQCVCGAKKANSTAYTNTCTRQTNKVIIGTRIENMCDTMILTNVFNSEREWVSELDSPQQSTLKSRQQEKSHIRRKRKKNVFFFFIHKQGRNQSAGCFFYVMFRFIVP